jgi:hypothetical protein
MTSFIATFGPSTINIIPTLQDLNLTKSKRQGNLKMTEYYVLKLEKIGSLGSWSSACFLEKFRNYIENVKIINNK